MQEVKVTVNGGNLSQEELQLYISRGRIQQPHNELIGITVNLDGDYADMIINTRGNSFLRDSPFSVI